MSATTKMIFQDATDIESDKNYQTARHLAHRLSDKVKADHSVIDDLEAEGPVEEYLVVPSTEVPAGKSKHGFKSKALYTARPGTVTYMQYKSEAESAGVAVMGKKEWTAQGCLSYSRQILNQYGDERGHEMLSKAKHKGPRPPKEIAVAHVGEASVDMPTRGKTRLVWEIADGLVTNGVSAARNVIIEACIEQGVNKATAATQYSAWVRARREAK